jgi:hypothetical protein
VEHVEVANEPEGGAEPVQLAPQPFHPPVVEQGPARAQDGPEAADRDPHLVDMVGVLARAGPGLVRPEGLHEGGHLVENVA